jgi:hypothetical protein
MKVLQTPRIRLGSDVMTPQPEQVRWHHGASDDTKILQDLIPIGPLTFQPQQDRTHIPGCKKDDVSS